MIDLKKLQNRLCMYKSIDANLVRNNMFLQYQTSIRKSKAGRNLDRQGESHEKGEADTPFRQKKKKKSSW
jgi:hypothetical protein